MRFLGIHALAVLLLCSNPAASDELISKNWISSQQDWYLIEGSVKKTKLKGIYVATNYLSMYKPDDKLEVFDGDANVIGYNYIGTYQSYVYVTAFDCLNDEEAVLGVRYYSKETPRGSNVVWEEQYEVEDDDFLLPMNEELFLRVCSLAGYLD